MKKNRGARENTPLSYGWYIQYNSFKIYGNKKRLLYKSSFKAMNVISYGTKHSQIFWRWRVYFININIFWGRCTIYLHFTQECRHKMCNISTFIVNWIKKLWNEVSQEYSNNNNNDDHFEWSKMYLTALCFNLHILSNFWDSSIW